MKEFDEVVEEYVNFLNKRIEEGYKVKMKDKQVKRVELVKNKRGMITQYIVVVDYHDGKSEVMKATAFMEKLVNVER